MPQIFEVLKCYKCSVFQVHQTKKSNKWQCKVCGENQSIKRNYGIGTAKECRLHVQRLNGLRGDIDEYKNNAKYSDDKMEHVELSEKPYKTVKPSSESKWLKYSSNSEDLSVPMLNESMYLNNKEVEQEFPKTCSRKFATKMHENIVEPNTNIGENKCDESQCDKFNFTHKLKSQSNIVLPVKRKKQNTKNFIPPKMKTESKWAQFADIEPSDYKINTNVNENSFICDNKKESEFSLPLFSHDTNDIEFKAKTDIKINNESPLDDMEENIPKNFVKMKKECQQNETLNNYSKETTRIEGENLSGNKLDLFSLYDDDKMDNLLSI